MKKALSRIPFIAFLLLSLLGTSLVSSCGTKVLTLVFTTGPQIMDAGVSSTIITVQIQDSKNRVVSLKTDTVLSLTSSSATGRFDTSPSGLFNGTITSVTITARSSSASFYYRDTTAGTATITVAELPSLGWNPGIQQETINPALTVTTISLPDAVKGEYYSQNLGCSGGTGTYTWSVTAGVLPVGLTFGGNTISGVPLAAGEYSFTVQVNDGIGSVAQVIPITVHEKPPVTPLLSVSPSSLSFGIATNQKNFLITNIGGETLTWSVTSNQPWVLISPSSGTGNATITVVVDRGVLYSGSYSATITINSNGGTQTITVSVQVQK